MSWNGIVKHYAALTAEERFRLIVAAGLRGDKAEQDRLAAAGRRMKLELRDDVPFALAFDELALVIFIELLALAATYLEAVDLADHAERSTEAEDAPEAGGEDAGGADTEGDANKTSLGERYFGAALALGYALRLKADGWKFFCDSLSIPPFAVWETLPGFARLQRALNLAERAAFVPVGMVRWLNSNRPAGEPEVTAVSDTPEQAAAGIEIHFRELVARWDGE